MWSVRCKCAFKWLVCGVGGSLALFKPTLYFSAFPHFSKNAILSRFLGSREKYGSLRVRSEVFFWNFFQFLAFFLNKTSSKLHRVCPFALHKSTTNNLKCRSMPFGCWQQKKTILLQHFFTSEIGAYYLSLLFFFTSHSISILIYLNLVLLWFWLDVVLQMNFRFNGLTYS